MDPLNKPTKELLALVLKDKAMVLDAGCGDAAIAIWLAARGHFVLGIDKVLPLPQGSVYQVSQVWPGEIRLLKAQLEELTPKPVYDCVLGLGLIHTIGGAYPVENLLRRLYQWLRPEGTMALSWLLDVRPVLAMHQKAYFPSEVEVESVISSQGATLLANWSVDVEHSHNGPVHRHRIAYAAWKANQAAILA
jgi:2-polyprenyl-3-methyl-5-hydroxy-6-metoxy-1,4-benzoquinol methylase